MDEEERYIEICGSEKEIHWCADRSEDRGFFYRILDLKDERPFLYAYIDISSGFMQQYTDLEGGADGKLG